MARGGFFAGLQRAAQAAARENERRARQSAREHAALTRRVEQARKAESRAQAQLAKADAAHRKLREKEAQEAGADFVGSDELIKKISEGWFDFDKAVATPDMMAAVGRIGKVLGPRGLMPNPKTGTVSADIARAVKEIKAGKLEFRVDKAGIVHVPGGKASFEPEKLNDTARAVLSAILRAKPAAAKGNYIRGVTLSTTMGPGVKIDLSQVRAMAA